MKKLTCLLPCIILCFLFSCTKPSGVEITQHFPIEHDYYRLFISDGMEVTVTDDVDDIVITADENVMETIKVVNRNGELRITRTDFSIYRMMKADVLIPYNYKLRDLNVDMYSSFTSSYGLEGEEIKITADFHSDIEVNYILADHLKLNLEYYSDFEADLDVMDLLELSMSDSEADITGNTATLKLDMKSSSEIIEHWSGDGYAFACDYCYGTMHDNCIAYLHCYDEIAVELTENSFLHCTGEPYIDESSWDETSCILFE